MTETNNEKPVMVLGPVYGIFRAACDVLDSPTGPDYKLFQFKDDRGWPELRYVYGHSEVPVKKIIVFASYGGEHVGWGEDLGKYRIVRRLPPSPGFFASFEGTMTPELKPEPVTDDELRCEDAILSVLEREPRIALRVLRRKTHAYRFGEAFALALKSLEDAGELKLESGEFSRSYVVKVAPSIDSAGTTE